MNNYQAQLIIGIKRLRKNLNLTQEKFAERIGLTLDGIRNIEQGRSTPTAKTIDLICTTFNVRPVELLLETPTTEKLKLHQTLLDKINITSMEELKMANDMLDFIHKNFRK